MAASFSTWPADRPVRPMPFRATIPQPRLSSPSLNLSISPASLTALEDPGGLRVHRQVARVRERDDRPGNRPREHRRANTSDELGQALLKYRESNA